MQEVVDVGTLGLRVAQRWVDCERTGGGGRVCAGSGIVEDVEGERMARKAGRTGVFEREVLWVTAKKGELYIYKVKSLGEMVCMWRRCGCGNC